MRTILFLALLTFNAALATAQTAGDAARGNTPPGTSQDGAKPADGAIKGGSILPGEKAGVPSKDDTAMAERRERCKELSGSLREECLKKENDAAGAGGTLPSMPNDTKDILKK